MSAPPGLDDVRLWQLVSPSFPIGAYAYSDGLEYAVENALIRDTEDLEQWLRGQLAHVKARLDVPLLLRMAELWRQSDEAGVARCSRWLQAARDAREPLMAERHMGQALARVLAELGVTRAQSWANRADASQAALFALAGDDWAIPATKLACAYLWGWCENQVLAAVKLVPLGQTQGQRLLARLAPTLAAHVETARTLPEADWGGGAPGVAMASARHERQYSRLFRS